MARIKITPSGITVEGRRNTGMSFEDFAANPNPPAIRRAATPTPSLIAEIAANGVVERVTRRAFVN